MKNKRMIKIYQLTGILLIIDQIIKIIINNCMELYQEIVVIPKFFSILFVKNTGAAFSIFSDGVVYLSILSVVFILIINHYIKKEINDFNKYDIIAFGMILGGIFGNLIDRIIHHGVIDYLSFSFGKFDFAVFNFADICIVCGVLLLIVNMLFLNKKKG